MKTRSRQKVKFLKIDRLLIGLLVILLVASPVIIVYSKSSLSQANIKVEKLKNKVEKQRTINESLTMKLNELASLTSVQDVAKDFNLTYKTDNIIVVK